MTEHVSSNEKVCAHDFVCIGCGASLDDLQQPLGWMTEGGEQFIEHRLKLERPEDFVRFSIPVPRVPVPANEEGASAPEPPADALALARRFHEAYERLAPSFGYETRTETRVFDPESKNGRLMVAVCAEIGASQPPGAIQLEGECPSCRQWVVLRTDTDEVHSLPEVRCACGAHEWPPNSVQIEDSRGRLHTLRGCQPGATATKEVR